MSVLVICFGLLFGLLALLAVPIVLAFTLDRTDKFEGQVNICWLFGLVRFCIAIPNATKSKQEKVIRQSKPAKVAKKRKNTTSPTNLLEALKQQAFRRRLYRFIKELLHAVHPHELFLRLRIGLGDPADTGRLWALLGPVAALAANIRSAEFRIEPEFMDPVFELQGRGKIRLIPIEFVVLTITFLLSPPSLRAWKTLNQRNS